MFVLGRSSLVLEKKQKKVAAQIGILPYGRGDQQPKQGWNRIWSLAFFPGSKLESSFLKKTGARAGV